MFTEIMKKNTIFSVKKIFKLENPIQGYSKVIVSCKPNGTNGLKGSFFIHGTKDGYNPEKELDWDADDCDFNHEEVLTNRIKRGKSIN